MVRSALTVVRSLQALDSRLFGGSKIGRDKAGRAREEGRVILWTSLIGCELCFFFCGTSWWGQEFKQGLSPFDE